MFFGKKEVEKKESPFSVVVVGVSPLAFYLAAVLQEKGVDVVVKVSSEQLKKYGKEKNIVVKYSGKLKENVLLHFTDKLDKDVDYCLVASLPKDVKNDFMLLVDDVIKKTKIINLSSCLNAKYFENNEILSPFSAFFDGWFAKGETVYSLNTLNNITICCDDDLFTEMKKLFFETNIVLCKGDDAFLCRKSAEMIVTGLLMMFYEKSISTVVCDKKELGKIELAIKEVCEKLFEENKRIEAKKILQSLYDIPNDARCDFDRKTFLAKINESLEISSIKTPCVYEMISKIIKI